MTGDADIYDRSKEVWESNLKLFGGTKLHFPAESLVRLISGRYVSVPEPPATVMDHGFGHGNNLVFLAEKGYRCAGCEISDHLIRVVGDLMGSLSYPADLRPVRGHEIPFDSDSFDLVVSWDIIHYNGTRDAVRAVIGELHRVLKPGGVLLLSTVSPSDAMFDRTAVKGDGSYRIENESKFDNRQGLTLFISGSLDELAGMFDMFGTVRTGTLSFDLFAPDRKHGAFLVYGVK